MAITATTNRIRYTGNGALVQFAYPFKVFKDTDLQVYLNGVLKALSTDYSVSGVGSENGGTVTFFVAPGNGVTVLIVRVLPQTQESDIPSNDKFPSLTVEDALDKLTMLIQQLNEVDQRALKLALVSSFTNLTLPDPQANLILRWKADLSGLENASVAPQGAITLPVGITDGGTGATTAAAARTNLGAATQLSPSVLTPGASPAIDASLSDEFTLTANQNFTLPNPTNPTDGQRILIRIKQDGTGSRLLTGFGGNWRFGADLPQADIVLSTGANKVDYIGAQYNSTDGKWDVIAFIKGY